MAKTLRHKAKTGALLTGTEYEATDAHIEAYTGLTAGHVLRASGATAADFAAIQDADIPSTIARDSEVTAAVGAEATARDAAIGVHSADTTNVHGITDTSGLVLTDDSRLSDSRAPSGTAGGDLSGTYPNPSVVDDSHSHTSATLPAAGADLSGIDFLVGTASGLLSGEIVAGTSPGGELGGTWGSPTVDATHSGSTHAATQAAAEATAAADATSKANAAQAAAIAASDPAGSAAAVTTTSIGAVPTTRTITAGTGLTGGGDLSANRTLAPDFGTASGKVAEGNHTHAGGGGHLFPLDQYALDATYGDDFTGSSLSGIWTRRNFTAVETFQLGPTGSFMRIPFTGRAEGDGYFQAAPAGDWTFAMSYVMRYGVLPRFGVCCINSSGTGISTQFGAVSGGNALTLAGVTTYTTYSGTFQQTPTTANIVASVFEDRKIWQYIRKASGNYFAAYSLNGETWSPETPAFASGITVDRVGMLIFPAGAMSTTNVVDVDVFDKIA